MPTTLTKANDHISASGIGLIARIEQLRRLIEHRRFSGDQEITNQLYNDRATYIQTAVILAKRAGYTESRIYRLGQEINRMFDPYFSPEIAEEIIHITCECDTSEVDVDEHMVTLNVTREEYIVMLGSQASRV